MRGRRWAGSTIFSDKIPMRWPPVIDIPRPPPPIHVPLSQSLVPHLSASPLPPLFPHAQVTVSYTATLSDGTVFDKQEDLTFLADEGGCLQQGCETRGETAGTGPHPVLMTTPCSDD